MEFVHPFPGKKPGDEITRQEMLSAIRLSLCAEEEATHLYDTIAEYVSDQRVKKIMKDVAGEEQVHAGEFQKLLKVLEGDEEDLLQEGEDEAEEKMEDKAFNLRRHKKLAQKMSTLSNEAWAAWKEAGTRHAAAQQANDFGYHASAAEAFKKAYGLFKKLLESGEDCGAKDCSVLANNCLNYYNWHAKRSQGQAKEITAKSNEKVSRA